MQIFKPRIKEIIVVEGKDDISAVKAAVDCEMIEVNGFAVDKKETIDMIRSAYERQGIIILTDPDYAGTKIRNVLNRYFPMARNAFITREEGTKGMDIGVENASPKAIMHALSTAKCVIQGKTEDIFSMDMMYAYGLAGTSRSAHNRAEMGAQLGIGYSNAKQFLSKLNRFGIKMDEFLIALKKLS